MQDTFPQALLPGLLGAIFLFFLVFIVFFLLSRRRRPSRRPRPSASALAAPSALPEEPTWGDLFEKGVRLAGTLARGVAEGAARQRADFAEYLAQSRTPSELRLEIKRIDRELARRTPDDDPSTRILAPLQGQDLARFHLEQLHHARDVFEEHLAAPPALPAPGQGTAALPTPQSIEQELTNKYKAELAHGVRERVALTKARNELLAEHPSNADDIQRLFRQKLEKLADPDL